MDILHCQIGVLHKSETSKENRLLTESPVLGPSPFLGDQKHMFAPPSFWMGEQLLPCSPSSVALATIYLECVVSLHLWWAIKGVIGLNHKNKVLRPTDHSYRECVGIDHTPSLAGELPDRCSSDEPCNDVNHHCCSRPFWTCYCADTCIFGQCTE